MEEINFSKPRFQRRFSVSFTFVLSVRQYLRGRNHFAGDIRSSVTPSDPDSLTLLTYFPFPAFVSFGVNELHSLHIGRARCLFFKLTYTNIFKMTLTFKGASRYSSCVTIFFFRIDESADPPCLISFQLVYSKNYYFGSSCFMTLLTHFHSTSGVFLLASMPNNFFVI